jgi:DNA polymerase III alpha subunit
MASAEKLGAVKFDFLGVAALDKLWHAQDLVNQAVQEVEIVEDFVEDGDD